MQDGEAEDGSQVFGETCSCYRFQPIGLQANEERSGLNEKAGREDDKNGPERVR